MNDFINYLQHRIEETKSDLQAATDRMQQAATEREMLGAELQGYERTLGAEMRRQGLGAVQAPTAQASLPLNAAGSGEEPMANKAKFARQFVRERAASGVTPTDLFNGFVSAGIPIKKPYIYSLVQRLQNQNVIKAKRGKYYPADQPNELTREDVQ